MTDQVTGQLPLFEGPYFVATARQGVPHLLVLYTHWLDDEDEPEEVCDECGTCCTSSKECVQISGLYDEEE